MSRINNKRMPARALHSHIQGKCNPGRIPKKWMDNIKDDIKDLGLRQAVNMTRDRKKCKYYVITSFSTSG